MTRARRLLWLAIALGLAIIIFYFRYTLWAAFMNTEVGGRNFIGFAVEGNQTNGFAYIRYGRWHMQLEREGAVEWKQCRRLNRSLDGYLRNYVGDRIMHGSYMFISERDEHGYKAYIRSNDDVIFVWGFPDFGGTPPGEDEMRICDDLRDIDR